MNWQNVYKEKLATGEEAVKSVKSGDTIFPSHAAAEPKYLMDKLLERKDELKDVKIWQGLNIGDATYALPEYEGIFVNSSCFPGAKNRKCIQEGRGLFTPMSFSSEPKSIREGFVACDVYMCTVAPPDADGYVNFGISVDIARACLETARVSIALVNPNMPRTFGETKAHVSEFTYFVEQDVPLYELPKIDDSDPVVEKIGQNIAALIEDGATLQMGQGKIPNAILKCLYDKKDLGIHTEVFSDNLVPLIEAGVITCARKTLNPGKIVATFIQGTKELYDYVNNNDFIQLMPVDYVNDGGVISKNDKMIAVNAAIEVDLMGQVVADVIGPKQFSGVGGQLDFIRGAAASKGGKPVITLPATAKNGTISRIVSVLKYGTPVTTTRNDVHWVVTEFGAVNLFGKPIKERAELLISIAHPDFRYQLREEFKEYCELMEEFKSIINKTIV